jgi:outer membrane protein assembly factor BamB/predicted nucleic acid-binding Zn ribbon protein
MSSTPETEYWLICPVCHKPNPAGTRFCKHCWGAALRSQKPVSTKELEEILERRETHLRRRRRIVRIAISLASLFVAAAIVLPILYNYTDLLSRPLETLNSNSQPGEWAMFRHDIANTGAAKTSDALPQGILKWTFTTGGAIHSSPALADGTVYFGSEDYKLYAVDAATGVKRWEFLTGSFVESTPAIVGGIVYFGSNDGALYALDAKSGEMVWEFRTPYAIMSSPAVANGMVIFGADDYSVYALDALKGTRLWKVDTRGPVKSSPVVSEGIVYIGSGGEYVYAINAVDGRVRLRFMTYSAVFASPAVTDRTALFANSNGYLYAVNGNARNWPLEYNIRPYWLQLSAFGSPVVPMPPSPSGSMWGLRLGRVVSSSPVLAGDSLYIGADNNLLAIDLKNRQKLWSFRTQGAVRSTPAVAGNTIYVGSEDGRLYAVDIATGEKLWDFATGDKITSSPTVADGTVYIGSHDGKLYAIK